MTHIEAMKQALEALEYFSDTSPTMAGKAHAEDAITALRTAIEQAEKQEPVAWAVHYKGPIPLFTKTKSEAEAWGGNKIVPLYTTPPTVPVQETSGCQHKRYSVDVHEQTGTCYDCGAEGRMRFVVGDATSPAAPVQQDQFADSDLLNALKRIVNEPNNTMSDGKALKEIIRIARAAIAKATGERQ